LGASVAAKLQQTVELPGVLKFARPLQAMGRICTGIAGLTRTHNLYGPLKNRRIRDELGIDVLYH